MKVFEIFKKKQVAQATPVVEAVAVHRVHHNQIIEAIKPDGETFPVVISNITEDDFFSSSWQVPEVYTESITAHRFFFQVRSLITDEVWEITGEQLLMWTRPTGAVWA